MVNKNLGLIKANFNYDLIGEYKNKNQHGVEIGQEVLNKDGSLFSESFENIIDYKFFSTEEEAMAFEKYINDLKSIDIESIDLYTTDYNYLLSLIEKKYNNVETIHFNGDDTYDTFSGSLISIKLDEENKDIIFKLLDQDDNYCEVSYKDVKHCDFDLQNIDFNNDL